MSIFEDLKVQKDDDKRYFPRWEMDKPAVYRLSHDPDEKEARAVDLSCSGACIVSEDPLLPTQRVKLNVFLDKATVVSLTGKVVWIKHIPERNEAGIVFDALDQKTQDIILDYAFDIKKEDLVKHWFKGWDSSST